MRRDVLHSLVSVCSSERMSHLHGPTGLHWLACTRVGGWWIGYKRQIMRFDGEAAIVNRVWLAICATMADVSRHGRWSCGGSDGSGMSWQEYSAWGSRYAGVRWSARGSDNQLASHSRGRKNTVPLKDGQERSTSVCTNRAESHVDGDWQKHEWDRCGGSLARRHFLGTLWCWSRRERLRRWEAAWAIKLGPDEIAWDVRLLNAKERHGTARGGTRRSSSACREHRCRQEFLWQQNLEQEEMDGKKEFPARDVCTWERTSSGSTVKLWDLEVGCQSIQRNLSISHNNECRKRVSRAMRVRTSRIIQETQRWCGVRTGHRHGPEQQVQQWRNCGTVRRWLSSLQDLAEERTRPVCTRWDEATRGAELWNVRGGRGLLPGETRGKLQLLSICCTQVALDLRTGWNVQERARWARRKAFEAWRTEAVGNKMACASELQCGREPQQESRAGSRADTGSDVTCACWETDGTSDQANDDENRLPTFWNWQTRCQPHAKVSTSMQIGTLSRSLTSTDTYLSWQQKHLERFDLTFREVNGSRSTRKLGQRQTMTVGNINSVTCTLERLSTPFADGSAREGELQFAGGLDAWEIKPRSDALRLRLDRNKRDTYKPEYRSRFVVQETRRTSKIPEHHVAATTSATPPLELVKAFR